MENEWIDIPGYEGLYQFSMKGGVVKSNHSGKGKILKNIFSRKYLQVTLSRGGIGKVYCIHSIVMLIKEGPCPEGMEVCHNDGNPLNNHPDNLRYDTRSANQYDAISHGFKSNFFTNNPSKGKKGLLSIKKSKQVAQYSKGGRHIKNWESINMASCALGLERTNISSCCKGKLKTTGGYIWKYI